MRRILFIALWIAIALFAIQVVYFVFFSVRAPRYNEGRPLQAVAVSSPIRFVSALHDDENGNIWIGTEANGLHRLDPATGETTTLEVPDDLRGAKVRCLTLDKQGRLWVGTLRHGLFVRNGEEWKHYDVADHIPAIGISPKDGSAFVATETGLCRYDPVTDSWSNISFLGEENDNPRTIIQPTSLAFDPSGNLFVATTCQGIFRLDRDESGNYNVANHITAKRRYGPGSKPRVAPVPLDPCGEGLPSNQVNTILVTSDGTVWTGTKAGLAWSRDGGENWFVVRGRDYGDKMRGLLEGTPYKWKEIPRVRFGELMPEDDIALLAEGWDGQLWIGTRSLGCVAIRPDAFYRESLPKNDDPDSAMAFLTEMSQKTTRFHATKADQVVAMAPLTDGKILLASRSGSLEKMECPGTTVSAQTVIPATKSESTSFPTEWPKISDEIAYEIMKTAEIVYPQAFDLGDDYKVALNWKTAYGKTYALIGGGSMPHDKLIAFDESICKIRPFVGFVGNRTRPLERITLLRGTCNHDHAHEECEDNAVTGWSSVGNGVPRTYDGQHLWCEVKLNEPGRYALSLYLIDPDAVTLRDGKIHERPRDYLIEVFPDFPPTRARTKNADWQELGRRADAWSAESDPLLVSRVLDFGDGMYKRFELAGPGTYYVKIDKNCSRKIDLSAVFIDRLDVETPDVSDMPEKTEEQTSDIIP